MNKVVFISGASQGIGRELARVFSQNGDIVYGCSRHEFKEEGINYLPLDVTNEQSIKEAINSIISKHGHIDILINNAGMGIADAVENTSKNDALRLIETNYLGTYLTIKNALPFMRNIHAKIINMSSVASMIPIPFQSFYGSSKAAIDYLSYSLMMEVKPFGVKVMIVHPGDTKTSFTKNRDKTYLENDPNYQNRISNSVKVMEHDEQSGMSATLCAKKIYKRVVKKNPPLRYIVGFKNKLFVTLFSILPKRLCLKILYSMYGK